MIVDVATLTGAQLVALGSRTSAVMANDDALRAAIVAAAGAAGEQMWPMPLPVELRASMDSTVADIANMGDKYGGMLVAGLFLKEFVAEGHPLGAPGHRRAGVQRRRAARLHPQGRHRARRPHPGAARRGPRRRRAAAGLSPTGPRARGKDPANGRDRTGDRAITSGNEGLTGGDG